MSNPTPISQILEKYQASRCFEQLKESLSSVTNKTIHINGLSASTPSILTSVSFLDLEKHILCVMPSKEEAAYFQNDLQALLPNYPIYFFCDSFRSLRKGAHKDATNLIMRTEVMDVLSNSSSKKKIIVTYPEAVLEKMVPTSVFKRYCLRIKEGELIDMDDLNERLYDWGFERVDFVVEAGQFSIRGGIIDIFSFGEEHPYRVELFDDEVEAIRHFDLESQRSVKIVKWAKIIPDTNELAKDKAHITLFDAINKDDFILFIKDLPIIDHNWSEIYEKSQEEKKTNDYVNSENSDEYVVKDLFAEPAIIKKQLTNFQKVEFGQRMYFKADMAVDLKTLPQPSFNKQFDLLSKSIKNLNQKHFETYIFSPNSKQIERFYEIFEDIGSQIKFQPIYARLHEGFIDEENKIACYTDHQIFNRFDKYQLRKKPAKSRQHLLKFIQELQSGDYIVHVDHGVGKYAGIQKIKKGDSFREVMKLIYHGGDVLYVNIHSLHKVSKYSGKEGTEPKINKLGSDSWERLKRKTKTKVKDIAGDLIKLYAQRRAKKGFGFAPDNYLQTELEASFIYEDTPDQLKATNDVKADMEATYPMDRLICGDVGFGKTEVAMRAAFKAVNDSKQVAILVPTTILAFQHYTSFKKRFEDFPCNVDYVNRFKSSKDLKQSLNELEIGKTDIIIGTHKLLGKDVKFKDLGLMIIDEEQKFGVAHKERLRNFKSNVDTLTLSATPIPRTLQFSLMGARDLSIMSTPPPNRQAIETNVSVFQEDLIGDAVNYELSRGGQVFFIHNRIKDLERLKEVILGVSPHARIVTAHGQMNGKDLENKFMAFMRGEQDVLLSTSLVESGIDLPNVNTIIINNAHHFGLSDLHQLRGRVGRSNRKAFCYLFSPPYYTLSTDARKRLKSLEEFADLGSGFNIAMRDMDIRGAGNLLGAEQSGFVAEIGLDMFHKILDEAIQELKEKEFKDLFVEELHKEKKYVREVQIETDFEVMIPDWYVNNVNERLSIYTRIDKAKDENALQQIEQELQDRFGQIPNPVYELFSVVKLRWSACKLGIEKISIKKDLLRAVFIQDQESSFYTSPTFQHILVEVQKRSQQCQLKQTTTYLMLKVKGIRNIKEANAFLKSLLETN